MWKRRVDDVRAAGGAERLRAGNGPGRCRAPTLGSARRDGRGDGVGRRREDGLRAGLGGVRAAGGAERRRAGSAQFCCCCYYCKLYLLARDGHGRGTNPRRPSSNPRSASSCSCLPGPPCSSARRAEGMAHPSTATTSPANQMPAATRAATRAALGPAAPALLPTPTASPPGPRLPARHLLAPSFSPITASTSHRRPLVGRASPQAMQPTGWSHHCHGAIRGS